MEGKPEYTSVDWAAAVNRALEHLELTEDKGEAAHRAGVAASTLSRWLKGKFLPPPSGRRVYERLWGLPDGFLERPETALDARQGAADAFSPAEGHDLCATVLARLRAVVDELEAVLAEAKAGTSGEGLERPPQAGGRSDS